MIAASIGGIIYLIYFTTENHGGGVNNLTVASVSRPGKVWKEVAVGTSLIGRERAKINARRNLIRKARRIGRMP